MFVLTTEHSFDSAHFLKGYSGKCSNIHGHRWRVVAKVYSDNLVEIGEERGMVVDFKTLKRDFKAIIDGYDHALIVEKKSLKSETLNAMKEEGFNIIEVPFRPTAEEISRHFYHELEGKGYKVKNMTVYETPTNSAIYER